jgi:hypothetical protein
MLHFCLLSGAGVAPPLRSRGFFSGPRDQRQGRIAKDDRVLKVGWILLILVAFCWLACDLPLENESSGGQVAKQSCWRRTVNGWEDAEKWQSPVPQSRIEIHPLLVVLLQSAAVGAVAVLGWKEKA